MRGAGAAGGRGARRRRSASWAALALGLLAACGGKSREHRPSPDRAHLLDWRRDAEPRAHGHRAGDPRGPEEEHAGTFEYAEEGLAFTVGWALRARPRRVVRRPNEEVAEPVAMPESVGVPEALELELRGNPDEAFIVVACDDALAWPTAEGRAADALELRCAVRVHRFDDERFPVHDLVARGDGTLETRRREHPTR
ncbi:MAG TPA: hypothetical protein RMH85_06655 [Polyangiaceae bacterium LLY-WYZ-15_(1-7)]|nr:hypothetical protein [Sandaracinus sp.]HJL03753.1 hypothetical protein [Polyangiaceae bacterium LLY-WYZ-15_(1-7)]MBJ71943.1 hypothetical protein [Sandaracinus sp.]HJL08157.1 hypothetical protein [Polyangiaceae bacterium LLY-WYZ-15_(1-7)]HJL21181.1 hypothetical protein [Polyangiaceae bacterium LLY-WYZ-15_(1-7)]